jgi:hypothetical protein
MELEHAALDVDEMASEHLEAPPRGAVAAMVEGQALNVEHIFDVRSADPDCRTGHARAGEEAGAPAEDAKVDRSNDIHRPGRTEQIIARRNEKNSASGLDELPGGLERARAVDRRSIAGARIGDRFGRHEPMN